MSRLSRIGQCGLWLAAVTASFLHAQSLSGTYGQHLLDQELVHHPGLQMLRISVVIPEAGTRVIVSRATNGKSQKLLGAGIKLPLLDVVGATVGELTVWHSARLQGSLTRNLKEATSVQEELGRHTLEPSNLTDAYPYSSRYKSDTYGQHLVEETLAKNPDVLVLAMHARPSENAESVILASSFGRVGKLDDEGDLSVVRSNGATSAITKAGNRFNVGLPMHNILGNTIGLVTVAFAYHAGTDQTQLIKHADAIRDQLASRVLDAASLTNQYP